MLLHEAGRIYLGERRVDRVYVGANQVWGDLEHEIRQMFANGEIGAWYDPSDLSTMFQDAAGTIPAVVDGPVGLMLDKSGNGHHASQPTSTARPILRRVQVLGPELIPQPVNFNADWVTSGAGAVVSATEVETSGPGGIWLGGVTEVGKTYRATAQYEDSLGSNVEMWNSSGSFLAGANRMANVPPGGGSFSIGFTATHEDLYFRRNNAGTIKLNTFSVREITGYTDRYYLEFDGIDDFHIINFPSPLGSNCTIARAIPDVGAEILTGQTVGDSYSITESHAGFVIIDRALTQREAAYLTKWLNKRAGL